MSSINSLRAMHKAHPGLMTKSNLFFADLSLIQEDEGFNTRDLERPEVVNHIRNLADAYKAGEELPPLKVKVIDGTIYLRDGYCRKRAALMAKSEGAEINSLAVLPVRGDEIDQTLVILTSNDGLKLTPFEIAQVYVRLVNMNLDISEIVSRTRITRVQINNYLSLHDLPIKLKNLISEGAVKWSYAVELYRDRGKDAIPLIEKLWEKKKKQAAEESALQNLTSDNPGVENSSAMPKNGKSENGQSAESQPVGKDDKKQDKVPDSKSSSKGISQTDDHKAVNSQKKNSSPAHTKPPVTPKPVTKKDVNASEGYRARITGHLLRRVTDGLRKLHVCLDEADKEIDGVSLHLTAKEVEEFRDICTAVLPAEPSTPKNGAGKNERPQAPTPARTRQAKTTRHSTAAASL